MAFPSLRADESSRTQESQNLTDRITGLDRSTNRCAVGGYSDIYQARIDEQIVAVKVFREVHVDGDEKKRSLARNVNWEMRLWSSMQHENILPFLGFCFFHGTYGSADSDVSTFSLVSPWMQNGTVIDYVRSNAEVDRVKLLIEICSGLSYLHSKGVVHGDLKGSNILVSDEGTAVLADFGLARLISADAVFSSEVASTTTGLKGTVRYMAPELACAVDSTLNATHESDIWAFGCVVLELISFLLPYATCRTPASIIFAMINRIPPFTSVSGSLDATGTASSVPTDFEHYRTLWSLCKECWNFNPSSRPDCLRILGILRPLRFGTTHLRNHLASSTSVHATRRKTRTRTSGHVTYGARQSLIAKIEKQLPHLVWPTPHDTESTLWIQCDTCHFWYHFGCVGLAGGLDRNEEDFICPPCSQNILLGNRIRVKNTLSVVECMVPHCPYSTEEEYYIEKILAMKYSNTDEAGVDQPWLIKWQGYSIEETTWEPESNVPHDVIRIFQDVPAKLSCRADDGRPVTCLPEAIKLFKTY
ncbi:kinase-like protein [Sistotremastrum niveocremeum HHB9708]|uniref:Kinase-like protein n=1 Tax=Sistotremastrum niveocremeum HHB9708 TaxID=1314777 RepID=A0A164XUK8_9AGAM|nr:kinase-like protein [Sistotremastrum niveocremeum HHB9708]